MTEPTSELASQLTATQPENETAYTEILDKHQEVIDAKRTAEAESPVPIPPDKRVL